MKSLSPALRALRAQRALRTLILFSAIVLCAGTVSYLEAAPLIKAGIGGGGSSGPAIHISVQTSATENITAEASDEASRTGSVYQPILLVWFALAGMIVFSVTILIYNFKLQKSGRETADKSRFMDSILQSSTDMAIIATDPDLRITYYNETAEEIFLYKPEEVLGRTVWEIHEKEDVTRERLEKALAEIESAGEFRYLSKQLFYGKMRHITYRVTSIKNNGELVGYLMTARNISRRIEEERQLKRTNRALKVLNESTDVISHATDETQLINDICSIVTETGQYRLAWAGFLEHDENKSIRPVAYSGFEDGYLEKLLLTWADKPRGRGPTGIAIRTGRPAISRNIPFDPKFEPWREEAKKRGYASATSIPLKDGDEVFGAINIYATDTAAFDREEMDLLEKLAATLSNGIMALRSRYGYILAEAALEESQEKFKIFFENAATGMVIASPEGKFLTVNDTFCKMLGYTEEELKRKTFMEITHPDDVDSYNENLTRLKSGKINFFHMENRCLTKSGETVWVILSVSALRDKKGNARYLMAQARNITDHRRLLEIQKGRAERVIRNQKTLLELSKLDYTDFELFISAITEITSKTLGVERASFWTFNDEGTEIVCTVLYTAKDKRHSSGITLKREDYPNYFSAVESRRTVIADDANTNPFTGEFTESYLKPNGIASILDAGIWLHGKPVGLICMEHVGEKREWTSEDQEFLISTTDMISLAMETRELKRAQKALERSEEQIRKAERMTSLGTLTGGIAHDFNNLLTPILGYTEITQKLFKKESEEYQDLESVLKAARSAKDIIHQLLVFSRKTDSKIYPVKLDQIVKQNQKILRSYLPKNVKLVENLPENIQLINGDIAQIQQILINLSINAMHAMPDGGTLTIDLENVDLEKKETVAGTILSGSHVLLRITDTGIGMEKDVMDNIFDPFYTTKEVGEGTGLGLSTVFGIVQRYGGGISLESEPGKGTVFSIFLPILSDVTEKKEEKVAEPARGTESILIVEDEESIAKFCKKALEGLGYSVITFTSGYDALNHMEKNKGKFDLILSDNAMPEISGLDFIAEVRKFDTVTPAIMFTGSGSKITPEIIETHGIRKVLIKPLGAEEIGRAVRAVLDDEVKV